MDEGQPSQRSELESLLADKVPAALLSVTIGGVIAGPVGALVGAVVSPVLEYILKRGNEEYVASAEAVLAVAADAAGQPLATLPAYLEGDKRRLHLATTTVRAAMDTLDRQKLDALARVFAFGLDDDARLEMAALYVVALRELEAPHIRVLRHLVEAKAAVSTAEWHGARESILVSEFPGLSDGLDAIVATLIRAGLAVQTVFDGGDASGVTDTGWSVTPFGVSTYAWLRSETVDSAA
jgi:hypothetical protein